MTKRPGHVSDEADLDLQWAWEQVADPGPVFSPLPFDPVRDAGETTSPDSPDLGLPETLWGEVLRDGALPVAPPAVRPAPRRPTLAPAPLPHGRQSGLRRVLGRRRAVPRVAALALAVVVAGAGLLLALAAREPDTPPGRASQQIGAAGLQSTSTMPASTVPRAPSTSLTTLVTSPQPGSNSGDAPATTVASPPPAATAATTPATTAAPRSPARIDTPMAPAASSPEPAPAPAPTVTVAPPPTTVALLPAEPETTVTTRRPRSTVPESTVAPSTTVPAADDIPVEED